MFDDAKQTLAGYVLPRSQHGLRPLPSWPILLINALLRTLVIAVYRACWLTAIVWVIRHYWWHTLPSLNFFPAAAICLLAAFIIPIAGRTPAPTVAPGTDLVEGTLIERKAAPNAPR